MKKIIQWIASSFFRQAGRFLFFLVLGGLVALLLQHNDLNINIPKLLGFEYVKASSIKTEVVEWTDSNGNSLPNWYGQYQELNYGQGYAGLEYIIQNGVNVPSGSKGVMFSVSLGRIRQGNQNFICNEESGNNEYCYKYYTHDNQINLSFGIYFNGSSQRNNCYWLDNSINSYKDNTIYQKAMLYCPLPETARNITKLEFFGIVDTVQNAYPTYSIGFEQTILFDVDNNTQDIIDNQNQNTNTTLQYFGDTNTTSDVNFADSFFTDTNSTSESALQDIVSTPLTLLNGLVNGSYNNLCATLNNKQICLPSGAIIWQRQHGGAGVHDHWFRGGSTDTFIAFFNLVVGGFILYKCLISLFNSVHKMLDPTKTYVEVMKL